MQNKGGVMKVYNLTERELKALIFWATVGVHKSNGGSHVKDILKTIPKYTKLLRWKQDSFCCLRYNPGELGKELNEEFRVVNGFKIKVQ